MDWMMVVCVVGAAGWGFNIARTKNNWCRVLYLLAILLLAAAAGSKP